MITRNNPQIMREWAANEIVSNDYTADDIFYFLSDLAQVTSNENEAKKILILAIRATKNEGGYSSAYVKKKVNTWIANGLATAEQVGMFEKKSQQLKQPRSRFGQPLRNESPIEKFTPEQIAEQSKRLAKEDGFDDPEEWAKVTMEKFRELRATRSERMADKANRGLTSSGKRVVTRF